MKSIRNYHIATGILSNISGASHWKLIFAKLDLVLVCSWYSRIAL